MKSAKIKIFRNIIPAIKIYKELFLIRKDRKKIKAALAAGDLEKEREAIKSACVTWSRALMKDFGMEVNVIGRENLPTEGPVVFVANHQSYADIPACSGTIDTIQMGYIAKNDLAKIPLYKQWILDVRSVFIKRNDARESLKAILEGISYIEQGFSLLIFPEGTRSKGGPMKEFKKGSLKLALKPEVPIVPITINGTWKCFERQGYFKGEKVDLVIHEPIPTKGLSKAEQAAIPEKVENIIRKSLEELEAKEKNI